MVLTAEALEKISNRKVRIKLADELALGEQSIILHIKQNKNNGPLTTAGALKVIKENTDLSEEDEILTEEEPAKTIQ